MPPPSDSEFSEKLQARGAPEHLVRGGSEGLITGWRRFVAQVEQGYSLGLDDYRNDLDLRELIAVAGLDPEVAAEDQRLKGMLVAARRPIWECDVQDAFWVLGYPRNATGELLDDLRAEGLA